ncbi:pyridoxamine 5'-phosphate oxidase family protein [Runella sp.]|uniref:pyridoxamine 5'-phosphate oxidase family protein n=1 Tax=Runella sp. TaxID=1960881 RepID=UPI00301B1935
MQPTPRTTPSRSAKRAHYDEETVYSILDESLFCTASCVIDGQPFSIPTAFARYANYLYLHGSVGSHFIRAIETGITVCISVMLTDALVVAKSAFHHSVNYRSVVLFSTAEKVVEYEKKVEALRWITEKIVPESWDYLRPITESEVKKTTVLAFKIEEASAKLRTGMPIDEEEDLELPIWSGLIPLRTVREKPISDELSKNLSLPKHLIHL